MGTLNGFEVSGDILSIEERSGYLNLPSENLQRRIAITTSITDFGSRLGAFGNWQPLPCLRCGRTDGIVRSEMQWS